MSPTPLAIVLDYRAPAKFALNALAGALDLHPDMAAVPVSFADRDALLVPAIEDALDTAEQVLVLWSFYSPDFPRIAARLRHARARVASERVLHLAGGPHATAEPRATLEAGFDLVALGEGERIIVEVARALSAGGDARDVSGIAHLDAAGALQGARRGDVVDLPAWPPFSTRHRRFGAIEITRGCIYACGFCQTPFLNRARFRHRPVEDVVRWVRVLVEDAGFRDLRFITPTSLSYGSDGPEPDLGEVERLLSSVRAVIGRERHLFYGTFPSEVRPEHVTREALDLLRRHVDNRTIIIGAQSGSDAVLARTHRGHDVAAIERAAAIAREAGFVPHLDFIFGLPEETDADVDATLSLMEALTDRGARVHGHTFMPLPGTPLRHAAPGAIAPATRRRLDLLSAHGALYGQWERQAEVARELARLREGAGG